ncbi:LLM class flavin-dependent oxidoreductase [Rudaeicoccus suwonensis]|uniref:Alkanesulfonate monooxygenase SsuD/methylene tetrahydromethanopterin reductase-like flavin-dependent oxidoreductase (Luciferase family) n=1 Tax=Rudaeicoccus suwonensis TaxID=657409 RepID=A0A561ECS0_9MICO|nr:LLM class flavin-dependent oxidoreductase [Rudaeicoccus suwonensis]TWE13399.1 alkanesulfonate monooxygenase SsuD/methylene tetrahydromethanopterin reductase-like flavin-dependent oxidoreductase (luciferase family) [Rudaeicoccus suwonensis]
MPKVIVQVYPTTGDLTEMSEHRPIGRSTWAVQRLLDGLVQIAQAADELGYWGLSHTEHHFHSEGIELSPDPGLYNLWAGMRTKRLRHGQLGYVLPFHDPVRLAEETAMIDQMLGGRLFVGMARGYQNRWVDVLGQRTGAGAADHSDSERDALNWSLFREHYRIMKMAWTRDVTAYDGEHYRLPGNVGASWAPAEGVTSVYGAPGELDAGGGIRGVSVVPRPFQDPHPPLFQAQSISPRTVGWCAREGVIPIIQSPDLDVCSALGNYYLSEAKLAGRDLQYGDSLGLIRIFHIADSRSEALAASDAYDSLIWDKWYRAFGYLELFRLKGEEGPVPAPGESIGERLSRSGMSCIGTVDDVKRAVEKTLTALPAEYLVWHLAWRPMPTEVAIRQLELFAEHIMPEFGLTFADEAVVP